MSSTRFIPTIGLVTGSIVAALLPQLLSAQARPSPTSTRTSPPVLVVRASGNLPGPPAPEPARATASFSSQQLAHSLGLAIGTGEGVKVAPGGLSAAAGRVQLMIFEPESVWNGVARFKGHGSATVTVSALTKGEQYMIQCTVAGATSYVMSGPGAETTFFDYQPIVAVYTAADTNPADFQIKSEGSNWSLYSCQVSKVQP